MIGVQVQFLVSLAADDTNTTSYLEKIGRA